MLGMQQSKINFILYRDPCVFLLSLEAMTLRCFLLWRWFESFQWRRNCLSFHITFTGARKFFLMRLKMWTSWVTWVAVRCSVSMPSCLGANRGKSGIASFVSFLQAFLLNGKGLFCFFQHGMHGKYRSQLLASLAFWRPVFFAHLQHRRFSLARKGCSQLHSACWQIAFSTDGYLPTRLYLWRGPSVYVNSDEFER